MTKAILPIVLTILMYSGVVVFLFPYFTGRLTAGIPFMIMGATCTVVCGLLRCYLTEGDGAASLTTATSGNFRQHAMQPNAATPPSLRDRQRQPAV